MELPLWDTADLIMPYIWPNLRNVYMLAKR
jgi:hypothetical protein